MKRLKATHFTAIALTLAFTLCTAALAAQTSQPGRVMLQNSGSRALPGVQVTAYGAAPADTDSDGRFSLTFPTSAAGDLVPLKEAYKNGYELVNRRETERWILSPSEMVIVMAPAGEVREARERYYGIGSGIYLSRYEQAVAEIGELQKKERLSRQEYLVRIDKAYQQLERSQKLLEEYADLFARVNRDELGETERAAFALVDAGRIDDAIALYEEQKLVEKLTEQGDAHNRTVGELRGMVPSLSRYADILIFSGGRENLVKAGEIYLAIVRADPNDYDNLMTCANFFKEMLDYPRAGEYFGKAVECAPDEPLLAEALLKLGQTQAEASDLTPGIKNIGRSILIFAGQNGDAAAYFKAREAFAYSELAIAYLQAKDVGNAEKAINKGVELYELNDEPDSPQNLKNRVTLLGLRVVVDMQKWVDNTMLYNETDVQEESLEAIALCRRLIEMEDNMENRMIYSSLLSNLATFYRLNVNLEEAERYYMEAVEIEEELSQRNPLLLLPSLSTIYHQLGGLHLRAGDNARAAEYYDKTLRMRLETYGMNPNAFAAPLATIYATLGSFHNSIGEPQLALEELNRGVELIRTVPEEYRNSVYSDLCMSLHQIGIIYRQHGYLDRAEEVLLEVLELIEANRDVELANVRMITLSEMVRIKWARKDDEWISYALQEVEMSSENMNVPPAIAASSMSDTCEKEGEPELAEQYRMLTLFLIEDYAEENPHKSPDISDSEWTANWALAEELGDYWREGEQYYMAHRAYTVYVTMLSAVEHRKDNAGLLLQRAVGLFSLGMTDLFGEIENDSRNRLELALKDLHYILSVTRNKRERDDLKDIIEDVNKMLEMAIQHE